MFEQNLQIIKQHYYPYYETITNYQAPLVPDFNIEETTTKDGKCNLRLKKGAAELYLHSHYSPRGEAQKWVKTVTPETNIVVVLGGGYYYHIDELLERPDLKTIIIVEPSIDIFIKALQDIDMKKYLENPNVIILLSDNPDELAEGFFRIIRNRGFYSLDLCTLMSYRQVFAEFVPKLKKSISEIIRFFDVNLVTEIAWAREWIYNQYKNIININKDGVPLSALFDTFSGIPAVIVGAGPSLEKQLDLLKQNQDKFFVFSAGSSGTVLEKNGIYPHIEVAIDGGSGEDGIIASIKNGKTKLAYFPYVSHGSLGLFHGKKLWFKGNARSILDYYEEFVDLETSPIELGPSCVNAAMDMAIKFGCNPLIFIGQDLAYTNEQLYAKGAVLYDAVKNDPRKRVLTEDIYGNPISTNSAFLAIKLYFESYLRIHNEADLINCTEGGLNIEGMKNAVFSEVVAEHTSLGKDIFADIDLKYDEIRETILKQNINDKTTEFVHKVANEAREIEEKSTIRLEKVERLLDDFNSWSTDDIKDEVDSVNQITEVIESKEVHQHIMHYSVAAYNLVIRQHTHEQLETINDLKEKYRVILIGLSKQYKFYHAIIQSLVSASDDSEEKNQGERYE